MVTDFLIQPQDFLIWAVIGLASGLLAGMVIRGGTVKLGDAAIGIVGAILGGVLAEFFGFRGTMREMVGSLVAAFFGAVVLTLVLRLVPGRFAD